MGFAIVPQGCPCGHDPLALCHALAAQRVALVGVGCGDMDAATEEFFTGAALAAGGLFLPLDNARNLPALLEACAAEEMAVERLMDDAVIEVQLSAASGRTPEQQAAHILALFTARGKTARLLRLGGGGGNDGAAALAELPAIPESAWRIAGIPSLAQYPADRAPGRALGYRAAVCGRYANEVGPVTLDQARRLIIRARARVGLQPIVAPGPAVIG